MTAPEGDPYLYHHTLSFDLIYVPDAQRGKGYAHKAMRVLAKLCDENEMNLVLVVRKIECCSEAANKAMSKSGLDAGCTTGAPGQA